MGVQLQCMQIQTEQLLQMQTEQLLVQIIGSLRKTRPWEIRIPLLKYTEVVQCIVTDHKWFWMFDRPSSPGCSGWHYDSTSGRRKWREGKGKVMTLFLWEIWLIHFWRHLGKCVSRHLVFSFQDTNGSLFYNVAHEKEK